MCGLLRIILIELFFFAKFSNGWASVPGSLDRSLNFFFQKLKIEVVFVFFPNQLPTNRLPCWLGYCGTDATIGILTCLQPNW